MPRAAQCLDRPQDSCDKKTPWPTSAGGCPRRGGKSWTSVSDDNLFLTMARRPGLLDATWGFIRYIYGGGSSIEPELFELVRVRLAWNNRCVH